MWLSLVIRSALIREPVKNAIPLSNELLDSTFKRCRMTIKSENQKRLPRSGVNFSPLFRIFRTRKNTHLPAFAVAGHRARACMMAKRIGAFENKEFLKISINSRGFPVNNDKLPAGRSRLERKYNQLLAKVSGARLPLCDYPALCAKNSRYLGASGASRQLKPVASAAPSICPALQSFSSAR